MVKIVIKHEVKPSVLWPIETSLEYLYERTVRPFHALLIYCTMGDSKGMTRNEACLRWSGSSLSVTQRERNALGGKAIERLHTNVGHQ